MCLLHGSIRLHASSHCILLSTKFRLNAPCAWHMGICYALGNQPSYVNKHLQVSCRGIIVCQCSRFILVILFYHPFVTVKSADVKNCLLISWPAWGKQFQALHGQGWLELMHVGTSLLQVFRMVYCLYIFGHRFPLAMPTFMFSFKLLQWELHFWA